MHYAGTCSTNDSESKIIFDICRGHKMFLEVDNPLLDIDARVGIGQSVSVSQSVFTRIHNSIQYVAVYNRIYNT